jgi:hypothetical protein
MLLFPAVIDVNSLNGITPIPPTVEPAGIIAV